MTDSAQEQPRRSLRAHKEIDYLGKKVYDTPVDTDNGLDVPNGSGSKLSSLSVWKSIRNDDLALLHRLVFNRPGTQSERKKNLAAFHGFDAQTNKAKLIERIAAAPKVDIQRSLHIFGLPQTGAVKDLSVRFADFVLHPSGKAADPDSGSKTATSSRSASASPRSRSTASKKTSEESTPLASAASNRKRGRSVTATAPSPTKTKSVRSSSKKVEPSLPSEEVFLTWLFEQLAGKSHDEIGQMKVKTLRENAEKHFSLPSGSLNSMKDILIRTLTQRLDEESSPSQSAEFSSEPSIAHPEDSCNNLVRETSREASPSRALGESRSQTPSEIRHGSASVAHTDELARGGIRQVIDHLLHHSVSQKGSQQPTPEPSIAQPDQLPFIPDPNRSQAPSQVNSYQATPEPSVAVPDGALFPLPGSREISVSRTAESRPQEPSIEP